MHKGGNYQQYLQTLLLAPSLILVTLAGVIAGGMLSIGVAL